jgi:mitochondrial fission protein ELM1
LPLRDNVLPVAAPLAGLEPARVEAARIAWGERLGGLPRPWTALIVGRGRDGYRVTAAALARAGTLLAEELRTGGGALLVHLDRKTPEPAAAALRAALAGLPKVEVRAGTAEDPDARAAFLALADRVVVTADELTSLAEACLAGKPTRLLDLPRWYDRVPLGPQLVRFGRLLVGGGTTYRGTPHQQHALGRLADHLATRGLLNLPRDPAQLHRALVARGLVARLGEAAEPMARPKPLDDLARVAERVRRLMSEQPSAA